MKFSPFIYLYIFIAAIVTVPCQADNKADDFLFRTSNGDLVSVEVTIETETGQQNSGFKDVRTRWIPNTSIDRTTASRSDAFNFFIDTLGTGVIGSNSLPFTSAPQTVGGQFVIGGYFYADPNDVFWGDVNNPDLYIKVWEDGGRIDVNCFHVSVPDITCVASLVDNTSLRPIRGSEAVGTATLSNRHVLLQLDPGASSFVLR